MSLFDGVVTVEDDQVPVIIGLEEDGLRMSSGGAEIGEWTDGEYTIDHDGSGTYTITAEDESLRFVPSNPALFAAGLGEGDAPADAGDATQTAPPRSASVPIVPADGDSPEPKPATVIAFYAIAGLTGALGLWALVSLFV